MKYTHIMKAIFAPLPVALLCLGGCGFTPKTAPAPVVTVTQTATPSPTQTPSPAQTPTPSPVQTPTPTPQSTQTPKKADSEKSYSSGSNNGSTTPRTNKPHVYDSLFDGCPATIKKGQSGRCVRILQMRLNVYGFYVVEDGDFGSQTDKAVRSFQTSCGITVDGLVGTQTKTYLGG